jgi:uncharacterized protein YjbI with pentapeptide repeats
MNEPSVGVMKKERRSMVGGAGRGSLLLVLFLFFLVLALPTTRNVEGQRAIPPAESTPSSSPLLIDILNRPWPLWLAGADLSHTNLHGAQMSNANLYQAKLQGAAMNLVDLSRANLVMAALQDAQLVQAKLDNADLALANLAGARLAMASLVDAKLEGATLAQANLAGAQLNGASLSHAIARGANLRRAMLQDADLSVADLRGADLQGADLTDAVLNNANLQGANLQNVVLTGIVYDEQTVWPEGFDPAHPETSTPIESPPQPHPLRLQINLVPGYAPQFNEMAQPDDIAHVDHVSDLKLLEEVRSGQRMAVFKSVALAEQLMPRLAGYVDLLGYNLEHGPTNPLEDQRDPVAAAQRMRALADQYGLHLAIGPDHDFVVSHGVEMAPFADQFILQVQRVQEQPQVVQSYVVSTSAALREANPALEIVVQVRTEGEVDDLAALLDPLRAHMDGVAILTSPQTTGVATALWARLRQELAAQEATTAAPIETTTTSWVQIARMLVRGLLVQALIIVLILGMLWVLELYLRARKLQTNEDAL